MNQISRICKLRGIYLTKLDITQLDKQMTKDTTNTSQLGQSSQHPRQGPTNIKRTSVEEKLDIGQSIRCSFF